jgi:hypothetical protein
VTADVYPRVPAMLDTALPGLSVALSAHPPGTSADDDCRVHHVEWVPRLRCRVVHEVRAAERRPTLITCEVTPSGIEVRGLVEDRELPGLPVLLGSSGLQDRLAEVYRTPISARQVMITPVGHRPGIRAVVAYDVTVPSGRSRVYAKVLAHGADRYAAVAADLAASAAQRGARAPVPKVVAVWRDLGAVVQQAAPGRRLSEVLADGTVPERDSVRYADDLGRLLAGVHATSRPAEPAWTAEDELAALEPLLTATWHADPAVGRSLVTVTDRLADTVPAGVDAVLTHGAFRTGQVVADDGVLTLLDLDTVGVSDAARDAGNALAYLSWAEVRGALPSRLVRTMRRNFLAGYADARTALARGGLAWWWTAAMVKIAGRKFRSLATWEWRHVPALLGRAEALIELTTGPRSRGLGEMSGAPAVDPLDRHGMTDALRRESTVPAADHLRVVDARPVAEAPGRRRVVRYVVEGLESGGTVALIGKSYVERHRSAVAYENLQQLGEGPFLATPRLAVPSPVWFLPGLRMLLYREVTGTALDRLPPAPGRTVAALAARWLATMHASGAVLARRMDLTHEIADVEEWAVRVGHEAPEARAAVFDLADRLSTAAAGLPAASEVPVHRDFHAGHVLAVDDEPAGNEDGMPDRIVVVDLDEARMGDPAFDVAHFTTYLDASPWPGAAGARAAFLSTYGPLDGPAPELRTAFFSAYTSMKIAKQLVTGRGPVLPRDGRARAAALTAVLHRGSACLDG